MLPIIKKSNVWITFSAICVGLSIVALLIWGLKLGIDFSGGSLMEVSFNDQRPEGNEISDILTKDQLVKNISVQSVEEKDAILRFEIVTEDTHQNIIKKLNESFNQTVTEKRFDSIGPSIGNDLKQKTTIAIILALIGMVIYIALAFRKVSKPVESWKYGIIAIIALIHNIIITTGFFSVFGKFFGTEIDAAFIAAILTILGYSVNDTIVIFDRIRENLIKHYEGNFEETVESSVNESLTRSINTGMNVILVLVVIYFFGGDSTKDFALALTIGIFFGTYSSIFLASPLLVYTQKLFKSKKKY